MAELNPTQIPLARELFAEWQRVRGKQTTPSRTPFGKTWDDLLTQARLVTGEQEHDARLFTRELEKTGWLKTKTDRRRSDQILRVTIPLEAEERWRTTFGFVPPQQSDNTAFKTHPWEPELQFCATARLQIPCAEIVKIDHFLKHGGRQSPEVPIKERSLEIFGDEKRLDELYRASSLFDDGRLTLKILRVRIVPEPLPWKRGARPDGPMLTLENVATWDTFCRWDKLHPTFSAIIYGGGDRFRDGVHHLPIIHKELNFAPPHYYFGDLDPAGLRIPRIASAQAVQANLPRIRPLTWAYRALLNHAPPADSPESPEPDNARPETEEPRQEDHDLEWLENKEIIAAARDLFRHNLRLAQEHIGWNHMRDQSKINFGESAFR